MPLAGAGHVAEFRIRLYDSAEMGTIVGRIAGVETPSSRAIKDLVSRICLFLPLSLSSPFFATHPLFFTEPSQRVDSIDSMSITSYQFMRCFSEKFIGEDSLTKDLYLGTETEGSAE